MTAPFSEDDYRALLELETLLTDLEQHPGWQALKAEIEQAMEAQRRGVLGGELKDHDEYLKRSWMIRGAESVLGFPEDLRAKRIPEYRRQLAEREGGQEE